MQLHEFFASELEREVALTRPVLERVPMDRPDWKPHEKSMAMGKLAMHVAELPTWAVYTIAQDALDLAPAGGPAYTSPKYTSNRDLLEGLERNANLAREALRATTDEHLEKTWTLLANGQTIFARPRRNVLRETVFNHLVHHRAQLMVYLRLNNISVPAVYGPSADEGYK